MNIYEVLFFWFLRIAAGAAFIAFLTLVCAFVESL